MTTSTIYNYIKFTTTQANATINIVFTNASVGGTYYTGKMLVSKFQSNYFEEINQNAIAAFNMPTIGSVGYLAFTTVTIPDPGTYYVIPYGNAAWPGLAYISVKGVEGGNSGGSSTGLPIYFIDLKTSGTNAIVSSTGYVFSAVAYTLTGSTSGLYKITFIRTDVTSSTPDTCSVVAYRNSLTSSVTVSMVEGSQTSGTIEDGAPPG